jgi:hypothetical protein
VELDPEVHVGIDRLLVRQLDVETDGECAGILGSPVRGLHRPGTPARDQREARLADRATQLAGQLVLRSVRRRACRPEDADRRPYLPELVEPEDQLPFDPAQALGLGAL